MENLFIVNGLPTRLIFGTAPDPKTGVLPVELISLGEDEARALVLNLDWQPLNVRSAVWRQGVAAIISGICGTVVPPNRVKLPDNLLDDSRNALLCALYYGPVIDDRTFKLPAGGSIEWLLVRRTNPNALGKSLAISLSLKDVRNPQPVKPATFKDWEPRALPEVLEGFPDVRDPKVWPIMQARVSRFLQDPKVWPQYSSMLHEILEVRYQDDRGDIVHSLADAQQEQYRDVVNAMWRLACDTPDCSLRYREISVWVWMELAGWAG